MTIWSCLRTSVGKCISKDSKNNILAIQRRYAGGHDHRTMDIIPSRWQWHKFKDILHFYTLLGLIPVGLVIFASNVFVGPATLSEIPEGYTPKHWEYYKSPITRFLAKNVFPSPQQEYEKYLHQLYEEDEKMKMRKLEKQIIEKMEERFDYQAFYYKPISGKHVRIAKRDSETLSDIGGLSRP